ncbi:hypothetical protein BX600DRAFT_443848 [Xylariales sp. PMI_506]|nr:hypothetical protein BX600DRAFT_443848 [Xylariales sp. PMI_506]
MATTQESPTALEAPNSPPQSPTRSNGPPPGYKLVKRRKEDGTIITMMRKMTPEELEAAGQSASTAAPAATDAKPAKYKIVTVRDANGTLLRVKRPIQPSENSPKSEPAGASDKTSDKSAATDAVPEPKSPSAFSWTASTVGKGSGNDSEPASPTVAKSSESTEPVDISRSLSEQKNDFRQRRMSRLRRSLLMGFSTVVGSSVSHLDFDSHHHKGDDGNLGDIKDGDIIDSDQSWSDDDFEHDDHDHHDGDHADEDATHHHDEDSSAAAHHHGEGGSDDSKEHSIGLPTAEIEKTAAVTAATVVSNMATRAASAPPPKAAPPAQDSAKSPTSPVKENTPTEKVTYKVTAKELDDMEKKSADKDLERPLRHHWTNFSFYFMASLSIVLPVLFMVLGIFIFHMDNKSTDSSWKVMPDVIKVGVSAWPIVFAAVIAQVFKAYATWKVERGIQLIQLEQLVGSNSFGSAIKQPLVLRRLDILSLMLLLAWCFSPFGSQALQRTYTLGTAPQEDQPTIYYLDRTKSNKVFSSNWQTADGADNITIENQHGTANQMVAIEFISTFVPENFQEDLSSIMDQYYHPVLLGSTNLDEDAQTTVTTIGLPVVLPDTLIPLNTYSTDTDAPSESMKFTVTSSFFGFSCGNWSIVNGDDIASKFPDQNATESSSGTLWMKFNNESSASIDRMYFASANLDLNFANTTLLSAVEYSFIECSFEQRFIDVNITCGRTAPAEGDFRTSGTTYCMAGGAVEVAQDRVESEGMGTFLEDFSDDWVTMGSFKNPNRVGVSYTPSEIFSGNGYYDQDMTSLNMSTILPSKFAWNYAQLFNTWVSVGYCPECQAITNLAQFSQSAAEIQGRYLKTTAQRTYSGALVYRLSVPWAACFLTCTVLLVVAGIAGVVVESVTVAPDTLGYVSTVVRNSRYLHAQPTSGAMTGAERARKLASTKVMMQDVKSQADVGKIALGLKTDKASRLRVDRLYR